MSTWLICWFQGLPFGHALAGRLEGFVLVKSRTVSSSDRRGNVFEHPLDADLFVVPTGFRKAGPKSHMVLELLQIVVGLVKILSTSEPG